MGKCDFEVKMALNVEISIENAKVLVTELEGELVNLDGKELIFIVEDENYLEELEKLLITMMINKDIVDYEISVI